MLAKISICKSIRDTLRYHEQKIKEGHALCLYAGNFIKDADKLTHTDKLYHFERLTSLNERTRKPVLHVSLNFHESNRLSDQKMKEIAQEFMENWGRADYPYLVYRHMDSAQPHTHVVSTILDKNGNRHSLTIDEYFKAKKITRELELAHGLTPSINPRNWQWQPPGPAVKIVPGEQAIYPAMRNVFAEVIEKYRYTSLEELNLLLRPYNIEAYTGRQDSLLQARGGLLYRVLDDNGKPTGTSIKASLFNTKPTLARLEEKFIKNRIQREAHSQHLTNAIDRAFDQKTLSFQALQQEMVTRKIGITLQKDGLGMPHKIWFIDYNNKTVFEGSYLGDQYKAEVIAGRCIPEEIYQQKLQAQQQKLKIRPRLGL